ncbi:MAG: NADP-dependent oxidoreductase [Gammaproteobacteria bacterium]
MKLSTVCSMLSVGALALAGAQASAAGMMKAAVITDGKVKVESVPIPEPGQGQVRIKVRAVSVNPVDWKIADRATPGTQQIAGKDIAGVIDAVGAGAGQWKAGDAVVGIAAQGSGSYAEYALASVTAIAAKPKKMSFEEASGIPVVAETAWRAIVTVGNVQKGQRVLIHGAAGGVGSSAVQFAKARGAFVIGTASARNHAFLKSLGVDETIDYTTTRFETKVKDVDVVVNTADADTNARSIGVVKKGGILVSVVGAPDEAACKAAGIRCSGVGSVNGQMLPAIVDFANDHKYGINVEQKLTLADAAKAWEMNRAGHTRGKIVLVVSSDAS